MVRVSDPGDDPTGEGRGDGVGPADRADRRGRRRAVEIVTADGDDLEAVTDGGLSPAAREWLQNTPGATLREARRWDRATGEYRSAEAESRLQPRGEPGTEANRERMIAVNEFRRALREYRELEAVTE